MIESSMMEALNPTQHARLNPPSRLLDTVTTLPMQEIDTRGGANSRHLPDRRMMGVPLKVYLRNRARLHRRRRDSRRYHGQLSHISWNLSQDQAHFWPYQCLVLIFFHRKLKIEGNKCHILISDGIRLVCGQVNLSGALASSARAKPTNTAWVPPVLIAYTKVKKRY